MPDLVIQSEDGILHLAVLSAGDTSVSPLCDWIEALDKLSQVTDEPRVGRVWSVASAGQGIANCMMCIAHKR